MRIQTVASAHWLQSRTLYRAIGDWPWLLALVVSLGMTTRKRAVAL
jgi:hypothetical protein